MIDYEVNKVISNYMGGEFTEYAKDLNKLIPVWEKLSLEDGVCNVILEINSRIRVRTGIGDKWNIYSSESNDLTIQESAAYTASEMIRGLK